MGLDAVEIVMDVEGTFGISLPDDALDRIVTVGDLSTYITERLGAGQSGSDWTSEEVDRWLYRIVSDNLGVPIDSIRPGSRLIEDLGSG